MGDMPQSGQSALKLDILPNDPKRRDSLSELPPLEDVFSKEICRNDKTPLDSRISLEEIC
jgi:hypothetical protein